MQAFKLNDEYTVVCVWKDRRGGFKHVATLLRNGSEVDNTKICYINRTWERFPYASVLYKLIDKCFKGVEREQFLAVINGRGYND
jgi:hypothetical protein